MASLIWARTSASWLYTTTFMTGMLVQCWPGGATPRNPPILGESRSPQTPSAPERGVA